MPNPVIEIENLNKKYGDRLAVNNLSLTILEGEIFGLLGPNGAGKTTTISILTTLLPPDGGKITIAGLDIKEKEKIKPLVGFVPQELALYPTLSARDNLAFFGRIYRLDETTLKERITQVLELVGLGGRAGDAVKTFSGGMKRRLNIAAGLIHQPRILFLDEPTVGVDPQSRNFIFDYVEQLKAGGMTIIYTTHYMEEAERLCDRVAIMDQGEILALDSSRGLTDLLGGGVIHAGIAQAELDTLLPRVTALDHVLKASGQNGQLVIETTGAQLGLLELIELCNATGVTILSLEVLEPNLESVFLHLTGKRLRD